MGSFLLLAYGNRVVLPALDIRLVNLFTLCVIERCLTPGLINSLIFIGNHAHLLRCMATLLQMRLFYNYVEFILCNRAAEDVLSMLGQHKLHLKLVIIALTFDQY